MIVNEPLGAAEYDDEQPFGLPYHGVFYSDGTLHTELGLVLQYKYQADYSDGGWIAAQKSVPPSQFFDLHLPATDTPPDLQASYKYKYRNTAQINKGRLKYRHLNGSIYHSNATGNWIVRIDGVADLVANTAEITVHFIPFGVLGADDRQPITQQILLNDIGQTPLRQNIFPNIHVVNATPQSPFPTYESIIIEDNSCLNCKTPKIMPFYASRTGRKISIGIPATSITIGPRVSTSGLDVFPHSQVFLAWLLAEVADDPIDPHPTIKISLLYNNLESLGFSQTRHQGDYFYKVNDAGYPFIGGAIELYPPPGTYIPPCGDDGNTLSWVSGKYDGYAPSSGVASQHKLSDNRYYVDYELGFIDRILAVWFDDDESVKPLKITQYKSALNSDVIEDDYNYSVERITTAVCDGGTGSWRETSVLEGTSSGSYGYHNHLVSIQRASIALGDRVIRSYGQTDVSDWTSKVYAKPDYTFEYAASESTPVTTYEPDGPLYTAGNSLAFQFYPSSIIPRLNQDGRPSFTLSSASSIGTLMPCISISSNHGFFCFFDLAAGAPKIVVLASGKVLDLSENQYPWFFRPDVKYNLRSYISAAVDIATANLNQSFGGASPAAADWF